MGNQPMSATDMAYFYDQTQIQPTKAKRERKKLDDKAMNTLNKKMSSKFQTDIFDPDGHNAAKSLAARLSELQSTNSFSMNSTRDSANTASQTGPNLFTDTRLQAIKFLTEDMIKELESELLYYVETEQQPVLPGPLIYDWHSDWSDLTDKVVPIKEFPQWQTKSARDAHLKKLNETTNKDKRTGSRMSEEEKREHYARKSSQNKIKQTLKLTAISENKDKRPENSSNNNAGAGSALQRQTSATRSMQTTATRRISGAKSGVTGIASNSPNPLSRVNHNQSSTSGCLVTYQLSSHLYRDKGWTVLKINLEEELLDNERKALMALSESLKSIDEVRKFNEKFGLTKVSKIRFYGDHKKEQLEKYKNSHIRPKKSAFAMSILRNELPKLLNVNFMLDCISNPNLLSQMSSSSSTTLTNLASLKQKSSNPNLLYRANSASMAITQSTQNLNSNRSTSHLPQPPPMLNSQTNDGTVCLLYPNGHQAIVVSNVFGYKIEKDAAGTPSTGGMNFRDDNSSLNGSVGTANINSALSWQNYKNSFTTIVYEQCSARKLLLAKGITSQSAKKQNETDKMLVTAKQLKENASRKLNAPLKRGHHGHNANNAQDALLTEPKILAIITCTGYCVCYRPNGNPRFICTESGGLLCNKQGACIFQWKWEDVSLYEFERFKNELTRDLNEFIRLEYRNPASIKLKFNCNKENMEFELGCSRETQHKMHELLSRTISDAHMKSKFANMKMSLNAKIATLLTYKQINPPTNTRKTSASTRGDLSRLSDSSKIDKLLESSVSFKDIPVMKDLLILQKKIRSLLEEWLQYCRNSLSILEPDMYILPDLPTKHKVTRLNENHSDFNKIVLFKTKSRSAENLSDRKRDDFSIFESNLKKITDHLTRRSMKGSLQALNENEQRSRSAYIARKTGNINKHQLDLMEQLRSFKIEISNAHIGSKRHHHHHKKHQHHHDKSLFSDNVSLLVTRRSSSMNQFRSSKDSHISGHKWSNDEFSHVKTPRTSRHHTNTNVHIENDTSTITSFRKNVTFQNNNNRLVNLNEFLNVLTSRSLANSGTNLVGGSAPPNISNSNANRFTFTNEELTLMCPVVLHHRIVFDRHDIECRCRKQNVPFIHDVEFDYMLKLVPTEQIIIVVIIDSNNEPTNIQMIAQEMFTVTNKNRTQPCRECIKDENRFFYYDLNTAVENSDHTQPALVMRHNVAAGMCLIYKGAKLLYCDHIFNGYGYSLQDFLKQLQKTKEDALLGKYLPYNFRFNQPMGKNGRRTAWGGNIGGFDNYYTEEVQNNSTSFSISNNQCDSADVTINDLSDGHTIVVPKLVFTHKENDLHLPKINKISASMEA